MKTIKTRVICNSNWVDCHTRKGVEAVVLKESFYNGENWMKVRITSDWEKNFVFSSPSVFWDVAKAEGK